MSKIALLTKPAEDPAQKLMLDVIEKLRAEMSHSSGENRKELSARLDATLKLLENQFSNLNKSVDTKIAENTKVLGERLDNAAKVIGAVKGELGKMHEIGENVKSFTDFLRHSKKRGTLGEQGLNEMLADILPRDKFAMQYKFSNGDTVDAIIKTTNGLIPIDAKFPLENFRTFINANDEVTRVAGKKEFFKDVKRHIDAIAKKYIRPDEGTTDFAVMYVPAESVHYEAAIAEDSLAEYARGHRVHLVSPNGLFYFLRVILIAFQSQKIEENAKKVLSMIAGVKTESLRFGENIGILARHVTNAKTKMDEVGAGFQKLEGKIERVSELGEGDEEAVKLEKEN